MAKKPSKEKGEQTKQTNQYDVLIRFIDRTYDILNSGNIIGDSAKLIV